MAIENGLIENTQAFTCAISFCIFIMGAKTLFNKKSFDELGASLFFSLIPLAAFSRELSFGRVVGVNNDFLFFIKGFLIVILCSFLAAIFAFFFKAYKLNRLRLKQAFLGYGILFFAALVILFAQMIDKRHLGFSKNVILEESLELLGYFIILGLSFYRLNHARK